MKNPNSYGSVIKLSGKRRRPWAIRITEGWQFDPDTMTSKQKYKYLNYFETRKEAMLALAKYNALKEKDLPYEDAKNGYLKKTLAPTFEQEWLRGVSVRLANCKPGTINNYTSIINNHCTAIKNVSVDKITTGMLTDKVMAPFLKLGKTSGTVSQIKAAMSIAFEQAIDDGWIETNPVKRLRADATKSDKVRKVYSPGLIRKLYEDGSDDARMLLVYLYTGMRRNEPLTMDLGKVNLEEHYFIAGSKTKNGIDRVIPIHPCIEPFLKEWLDGTRVLFEGRKGRMCGPTVANRFEVLLKKYGEPHDVHEARHTFVSMCDTYGLNPAAARMIVGHSANDIHESVYTHKTPEELWKEIKKIPFPEDL